MFHGLDAVEQDSILSRLNYLNGSHRRSSYEWLRLTKDTCSVTWLISALALSGSSQARNADETMMQTKMRFPQMGCACTFQQNTRNLYITNNFGSSTLVDVMPTTVQRSGYSYVTSLSLARHNGLTDWTQKSHSDEFGI
jgi:hypothetical protein